MTTTLTPTEMRQLAEMLPDRLHLGDDKLLYHKLFKEVYNEVLSTEIPYLVSMVEEGLSEEQFEVYYLTLWNTWYRNEAVSSIIFNPIEHWLIRLTPQTRIACLWRVVGNK